MSGGEVDFHEYFPQARLQKNAGAAQRDDIQNVVQRMYVAKCFNVFLLLS